MSTANVLKFIKEKEAEFVDLRFTDPRGKLQHLTKIKIFIDETLNRFSSIFAAAGHPNAVFEINFENLIALTSGEIKEITE